MSPSRFLLAAVAACTFTATASAVGSSTVGATSTDDARAVLDGLCAARGGDSYWTPYSIARCQGARANKGFEAERTTCEEAGGRLDVARDLAHMNRANWSCVSLSPRS